VRRLAPFVLPDGSLPIRPRPATARWSLSLADIFPALEVCNDRRPLHPFCRVISTATGAVGRMLTLTGMRNKE
jgi:hypothetical protein